MTMPDPNFVLRKYLKIQATADRQIMALLKDAKKDVDAHLKRIVGNSPSDIVRREQLILAQREINRNLDRIWRETRGIVENGALAAARAAVDANAGFDSVLLRAGLSKAQIAALHQSLQAQAQQAVQHALNRQFDETGTSKRTLSETVYHSRQVIDRQVQRVINSALSRGLSAREFSKEVIGFIRPDTPGGARFAAMRLARTEINNAFHLAQTRDNAAKPWVTGQRWNLSGSHPKTDICDSLAGDDHAGLGAGVYKKADVPGKPHPQCLCFVTPETVSPDEWIRQFNSGHYDDFIQARVPVNIPGKRR